MRLPNQSTRFTHHGRFSTIGVGEGVAAVRSQQMIFLVSGLALEGCWAQCSHSCMWGPAGEYLPHHLCMAICVEGCGGEAYGPTSVFTTPRFGPYY